MGVLLKHMFAVKVVIFMIFLNGFRCAVGANDSSASASENATDRRGNGDASTLSRQSNERDTSAAIRATLYASSLEQVEKALAQLQTLLDTELLR